MSLNPPILWLLAGIALCVIEFIVPTAFVEFVMGISAIAVALLLFVVPQLSLGIQVGIWFVLSIALTWATRRFVSNTKPTTLQDSSEAQTLTEILPGETGRVLYEGNSWAARCGDEALAIAPQQKVYVIGRRGTTLIVMPQSALNA